jgi:hypothetical protein
MGIYPSSFFQVMDGSVAQLVSNYHQAVQNAALAALTR